jgi:hypothetical protein
METKAIYIIRKHLAFLMQDKYGNQYGLGPVQVALDKKEEEDVIFYLTKNGIFFSLYIYSK